MIDTVIIDGRIILERGRFTKIEEAKIVLDAQSAGHRLAMRSYGPEVFKTCTAISEHPGLNLTINLICKGVTVNYGN